MLVGRAASIVVFKLEWKSWQFDPIEILLENRKIPGSVNSNRK
jgi:hypothetical protein